MKFTIPYTSRLAVIILVLTISTQLRAQKPVTITIDLKNKAQTIQSFGASGCWYSESIGLYWPDSTKKRMAELLFSKAIDKQGNPKGIGLSAWRFNIGAGTAEQGDSSGIKDVNRRTECFLNADGTYNWNKEQGYLWFVKQARAYGVENLIAFVNSPPVYYTQNHLGYKTTKDGNANLPADKYSAYADFLAVVLTHFNNENIYFSFISPVNEPQWQWYNKFGEASQEGSPYTNEEIFKVVKTLDQALTARQLSNRILIPEAGMLNYLYSTPKNSMNGSQIQNFWSADSALYLGNLPHLGKFIAGHGYFTDDTTQKAINIRQQVADTAKKYKVEYWQSEYSMLGDGFKEGGRGNRSGFDCAMFLAKLIYYDLTYGNASSWQFWNSWEPGAADINPRYYLLALHPSTDFKSGSFEITKNLWALGHFSRFIRPGMARLNLEETSKDLLTSAFYGDKKLIVVIINNGGLVKKLHLDIPGGKFKTCQSYVTTAMADDNMKAERKGRPDDILNIRPRSIYTLVMDEN
ncbi:glycoside hydrolase [Mucilaginibacter ginsenosidivorans]|uniref:Beta-glycosidase n=1 Tax=Mucilaginibacter ginsenosidivorans TaxID=398053 RepID=A0A5B8UZ93_9SPHI|nr:glycoside hydrolase [Mucilaginibacter ginsenosidivorans]QEC64075.1 beta-glycosidase [Mucilaginibacter ginsenosidivorans]